MPLVSLHARDYRARLGVIDGISGTDPTLTEVKLNGKYLLLMFSILFVGMIFSNAFHRLFSVYCRPLGMRIWFAIHRGLECLSWPTPSRFMGL